MKIDLHVHTSERSHCAVSSAEEQIHAAIDAGLDAITITDHHRLVPPAQLEMLNAKYAPFRIFGGAEITANGEDFLVFGVTDLALETRDWTYPELHAFVRGREGFIAMAHPFRFNPQGISVDFARYPFDAMEVHSNNISPWAEKRICAVAADMDIPLLCNSDAHRAEAIGKYYNELDRVPANEHELISLLRAGNFQCHCANQPLWRLYSAGR